MDFLDGAFAQHLVHYGYGAIFLIVMIESGGIPIPGETVLVSAAVYAGTRHALEIRFVIAAAAAGAIVGDNIGFWVGREFGVCHHPAVDAYPPFFYPLGALRARAKPKFRDRTRRPITGRLSLYG